MMSGYDVNLFLCDISKELICSICLGIFNSPVQETVCSHIFCQHCITQWIQNVKMCPLSKNPMNFKDLRSPPKRLTRELSDLTLQCEFQGCDAIINYNEIESHYSRCKFNPNQTIMCTKGCGVCVPRDKLYRHDCVQDLEILALDFFQLIEDIKTFIENDRGSKGSRATAAAAAAQTANGSSSVLNVVLPSLKANFVQLRNNFEDIKFRMRRVRAN